MHTIADIASLIRVTVGLLVSGHSCRVSLYPPQALKFISSRRPDSSPDGLVYSSSRTAVPNKMAC